MLDGSALGWVGQRLAEGEGIVMMMVMMMNRIISVLYRLVLPAAVISSTGTGRKPPIWSSRAW